MHEDVTDVVLGLIKHLRDRESWPHAYTDEHWVAAEAVAHLRTTRTSKRASRVEREVPYWYADDQKGYADVYAFYDAEPESERRHLFFELKCIGAGAAVPRTTARKFTEDVIDKLGRLDDVRTRARWRDVRAQDAWLKVLGADTISKMQAGSLIGVGLMFLGVEDSAKSHATLAVVRDRLRTARVATHVIHDDELRPGGPDAPRVVCFACRVEPTTRVAADAAPLSPDAASGSLAEW